MSYSFIFIQKILWFLMQQVFVKYQLMEWNRIYKRKQIFIGTEKNLIMCLVEHGASTSWHVVGVSRNCQIWRRAVWGAVFRHNLKFSKSVKSLWFNLRSTSPDYYTNQSTNQNTESTLSGNTKNLWNFIDCYNNLYFLLINWSLIVFWHTRL